MNTKIKFLCEADINLMLLLEIDNLRYTPHPDRMLVVPITDWKSRFNIVLEFSVWWVLEMFSTLVIAVSTGIGCQEMSVAFNHIFYLGHSSWPARTTCPVFRLHSQNHSSLVWGACAWLLTITWFSVLFVVFQLSFFIFYFFNYLWS